MRPVPAVFPHENSQTPMKRRRTARKPTDCGPARLVGGVMRKARTASGKIGIDAVETVLFSKWCGASTLGWAQSGGALTFEWVEESASCYGVNLAVAGLGGGGGGGAGACGSWRSLPHRRRIPGRGPAPTQSLHASSPGRWNRRWTGGLAPPCGGSLPDCVSISINAGRAEGADGVGGGGAAGWQRGGRKRKQDSDGDAGGVTVNSRPQPFGWYCGGKFGPTP